MRSALALALWLATAAVAGAAADEPPVPPPQGFVTDTAGVIAPDVRARIERLDEELKQKTGAEIAVLTVPTTQPLDDFSYAMKVAETWKPGRRKDDTGVLLLVATKDRKLRILTGYGIEPILPDGLVGEIEDREIVPSFRAGRVDEGIERGVRAMAARIAAANGVTLTGVPAPSPRPGPVTLPWWVILLAVVILLVVIANAGGPASRARRGRGGPIFFPGGFGGGGGGFGGGGGGFGGFGGGGFGGGGAGRSW